MDVFTERFGGSLGFSHFSLSVEGWVYPWRQSSKRAGWRPAHRELNLHWVWQGECNPEKWLIWSPLTLAFCAGSEVPPVTVWDQNISFGKPTQGEVAFDLAPTAKSSYLVFAIFLSFKISLLLQDSPKEPNTALWLIPFRWLYSTSCWLVTVGGES